MNQDEMIHLMEVATALDIIRNADVPDPQIHELDAFETLKSILAEDFAATRDIPRFDNSAMDGYAVRSSDLDAGQRTFPFAFEIRPEDAGIEELPAGTCARIMTGSPIPPSADFVIPVELTEARSDVIFITEVPKVNAIRKQGEGYRKGDVLLRKGSVVRPYEMGLIIEAGGGSVRVNKPLRVGLQISGSEIDRTNNTNGPVLKSILGSWPGVEVTEYPVLEDDQKRVKHRLDELKENNDIIVTTGGISAGKHDYFFDVLANSGAECLIRKINQKPGKPFTLFKWEDVYVCNLPGNPVSAVFTAQYYVRELVHRMNGLPEPESFKATALTELNNPGGKTLFVPGRLIFEHGMVGVMADTKMRSHLMQLYLGNHVYVRLDPGAEIEKGQTADCIPFSMH